jgi:hypothetical protein
VWPILWILIAALIEVFLVILLKHPLQNILSKTSFQKHYVQSLPPNPHPTVHRKEDGEAVADWKRIKEEAGRHFPEGVKGGAGRVVSVVVVLGIFPSLDPYIRSMQSTV